MVLQLANQRDKLESERTARNKIFLKDSSIVETSCEKASSANEEYSAVVETSPIPKNTTFQVIFGTGK
jgi:hypothetical protein